MWEKVGSYEIDFKAIDEHMPLAYLIVFDFVDCSRSEAVSFAYEALVAARKSFDETLGTKFSSWLRIHVRKIVQEWQHKYEMQVKISRSSYRYCGTKIAQFSKDAMIDWDKSASLLFEPPDKHGNDELEYVTAVAYQAVSPRELWVVLRSQGDGWTLDEIGRCLGLSKERVRQISKAGVRKIWEGLE